MKKVLRNKILNIENTDLFDNRFLFDYLELEIDNHDIEAFEETTRIMVRNKISDLTGKKVPTLVRFHQV